MSAETKVVVSVAEMARMVGLSRARFYQLMGTAFPHPVYDVATKRPIYVEELQRVCLEVRRRNCGMDGRPVLFYARRIPITAATKRRPVATSKSEVPTEILQGIKALGLVSATSTEIAAAIKSAYPDGTVGVESGEVIRTVFMKLMRQNRPDNVAR